MNPCEPVTGKQGFYFIPRNPYICDIHFFFILINFTSEPVTGKLVLF